VPFNGDDLRPAIDGSVGLTVSWDVFDLFRVRDSVEQARLATEQVKAGTESERDQIAADLRQAVSRVEQLRQRVPLADAQTSLARDNLQIVQDLYAQGSATILDLFNAQSSFRQARTQGASIRVDLATAECDLRWLLGEDLPGATP
jgi:outer membrane protein